MKPARLDIYRTAIAMRSFEHAAASRNLAEAVVVRLELDDGSVGWGETLPRPYVTGETLDSVIDDLRQTFWPAVTGVALSRGGPLPELPHTVAGRCVNAARCALELALFDALGEAPRRPIAARVSGVLGSADPAKTSKRLKLMWWYGLRDFKLKLGFGEQTDSDNLRIAHRRLGRAISRGKASLRVDVNGGWDADTTPHRVKALEQYGVGVVEQPVYCSAPELVELAKRCALPLMADESLLTLDDAQVLLAEPARIAWNIRISKNGGILAAARLAELAAQHGVLTTIGAMVGESSLLSAGQRRLLQMIPQPRFVEGNYGRFLLADDLTHKSLRFGYGGRLKALKGSGLGVRVEQAKLAAFGSLIERC